MSTTGKVAGIVSNLVTVQVDGPVAENELCYISTKQTRLLAESSRLTETRPLYRSSKAPVASKAATKSNF